MRKIYLILVGIIIMASFLKAQSFEFVNDSEEVISGTTIVIPVTLNGEAEPHFKVKNITSTQVSARIEKSYIVGPAEGSNNNMCTPITTLSPSGACVTGTTTPVFILSANEISGEAHIYYEHGSNPGVTTIQYKVFNVDNESDYKVLNITFSTQTSVNIANSKSFSVYPNPAVNEVVIEHNWGKKAVIEVFDVLGKSVLKLNSNSTDRFVIDCSKWDNGYYFCRLYNEGKVEKTIKLVVAH
ncbi:MAG TPA: T9SS type A sorting domain-containing protein [Bacteroidales bacterium]|nr:T9SS type A sorting domain-containing protein [Bacteroidales bacterium]